MSLSLAASFFRVTKKHVKKFERIDPFNDVLVKGFICRKKGRMGGSLFITHVDDKEVVPQKIYGTPKLAYPYKPQSVEFIELPVENARWYYLSEKWNGMNVLFFKYEDSTGKTLISAKSKGTPFISDGEYGNFLSLTKLAIEKDPSILKTFKMLNSRAISFELCGTMEPHLVEYDFEIALKPLFLIDLDGKVTPCDWDILNKIKSSDDLIYLCKESQINDLKKNEEHRASKGINIKYEYNHFITEGKVLYLLNHAGRLIDNTMFKIKPKDIEEVHWATFDSTMRGRIIEATRKIHLNEEVISALTLKQELDMGPKEWNKFGKRILSFINNERSDGTNNSQGQPK